MTKSSHIPEAPKNSFRITLNIGQSRTRLDAPLMEALRAQSENLDLKNISRSQFKEFFKDKRILIKGQPAKPSSELAAGVTYVDILL